MVWRTLRAMPLRLLEKVMPWVTGAFMDGGRPCMWVGPVLVCAEMCGAGMVVQGAW